jgi:hypothetical protein
MPSLEIETPKYALIAVILQDQFVPTAENVRCVQRILSQIAVEILIKSFNCWNKNIDCQLSLINIVPS